MRHYQPRGSQCHGRQGPADCVSGGSIIAINTTGWGLLAQHARESRKEQLDQITDLQFKGVHHFAQAFVRVMSEQQPTGGSINLAEFSHDQGALINNHMAYIAFPNARARL